MKRTEIAKLIQNGENSGVEFKRDKDIHPEKLGKVLAGFLNLEGGHVLLGVEDDGTVTGLSRSSKEAEEWVMEVARNHVRPAIIPFWETMEWETGKVIGVISLSGDMPNKPYKAKYGPVWVTKVRVGTTTRDATNDEEMRLYQQSSRLQYDRQPLFGGTVDDLDRRRLVNYFQGVRGQETPEPNDGVAWERLLLNTELLAHNHRGGVVPSVAGFLLFGDRQKRLLPQSGITAVAYPGKEKDYAAIERIEIVGPLVSLFSVEYSGNSIGSFNTGPIPNLLGLPGTSSYRSITETGVIEQALEFVRRNTRVEAQIDSGGRRQERRTYPDEAVREAVVNAVAHRDYTISVMDIELSIYADRKSVV